MPTKQDLRKTYLAKRMALSPDEYADGNQKLLNGFVTIDLNGINCISLFLPMLERREPDTLLIIDWLKKHHPQIKLAFPKSDFATHSMQHFLEDDHLEIDTNDYGIPEPVKGKTIQNNKIDMVIAPLLAFDKKGYRVGYGKGFYDRLMAQCKPDAKFIGLSFFEPVDAIGDISEYDIPLHQCITHAKIWNF
jgi:5-formyltetrahydrofolate cyclo-ligase